MASMTIKSTYSLDPGTIKAIEELARQHGVSKSEVLRRAVRLAAGRDLRPLAALDELQASAQLTRAAAREWEACIRAERRSSSLRQEATAR